MDCHTASPDPSSLLARRKPVSLSPKLVLMKSKQTSPPSRLFPRSLIAFLMIVFQTGCSLFGVRTAEEANYQIIDAQDPFEVREYEALLVAETIVDANFDEAGNIAFKRLFGYISGANRAQQEIAMTAPVMALDEQPSDGEKIAMTAPVSGEKVALGWRFAFVLPAEYSLDSAPLPTSPEVKLALLPARRVAVVRYSGSRSEVAYDRNLESLRGWMRQRQLEAASSPRFAGYDPPWTLPFLRRNEVLIDIKS